MPAVTVRIMHPEPAPGAGPLETWVATARTGLARRHVERFTAAGAGDVGIVAGPPDGLAFGARVRTIIAADQPAGLVLLGSGAIPLATTRDVRDLVTAAAANDRIALANNRYSADVIAVARAGATLADVPDLPSDNGLPRWLAEVAGYEVRDLRRRWHLAVDIDGPIDLVLIGDADGSDPDMHGVDRGPVLDRMAAVRAVARDPRAELLISGRTSAATLTWLERSTAARTRAFIEERGLRTSNAGQRPPASILGALLERDGPGSLGDHLARLADAAIVDTRVLLAHRLGADEAGWPVAEDRFASDLLLAERIGDPWLRELTASAAAASIPILLGGHTLVGPGVRLVLGRRAPGS
jgi:CTP:molybdopterin cytidylyltransferase MocA